jgi:DNA ligase-1
MLSNKILFETLSQCRKELLSTNSSNAKKDILKKYPELIEILNYTYDPFKKYFITSKQIENHPELYYTGFDDYSFYKILDMLHQRIVTGYDAIGLVNDFVANHQEYCELIKLVLDKNLKCRIDAKLINKVFPKTVPVFNVALAQKFEEDMTIKKDWDWSDWIAMRKLDGIRCITIIDNESNARFYSRKGNEFFTLSKIADEIKLNGIKDMVLDGELCIVDEAGNEDFTAITKEYNRKNHTIENPKYIVFDQLTHEEFESGHSDNTYEIRLRFSANNPNYIDIFNSVNLKWKTIEKIKTYLLLDKESLTEWKELAAKNGWEGLILRKNTSYEGKRTKHILKVKQFHEAEYKVFDYRIGEMRIINSETGLEETIVTMTNVLINHKNNVVSVGSGFSIDERKHYFKNPKDIIGKEITVKYFEESKNKNGGISLRFPTVKKIWKEGKRNI